MIIGLIISCSLSFCIIAIHQYMSLKIKILKIEKEIYQELIEMYENMTKINNHIERLLIIHSIKKIQKLNAIQIKALKHNKSFLWN